jgi:predicted MFS family arabinose efflux permease
MPIREVVASSIPNYGAALLDAFHFKNRSCGPFKTLSPPEWEQLLALSDSSQLTLLLGHYCRPCLPEQIGTRIDKNSLDYAARFRRLKKAVVEISDCFASRSIDYCLLKGFAHSPDFTPDPLLRVQGDIDLWCLPHEVERGYQALLDLGYRPCSKSKSRHLDPLIRETEWQWRGDYFASDLPIAVDLHFQLWDEQLEFFPSPDEQSWWDRRSELLLDGRRIPLLDPADTLTFAVLHFMMHLLHGDLRLQRAWEIAHFLEVRACDDAFWQRWESLCSGPILQLQMIAFDLVRRWFGCEVPLLIEAHTKALPEDILLWLNTYGFSPVRGLFVPNKDEIWLNLCLLPSANARVRVLFRRLVPRPHLGTSGDSGGGRLPAMQIGFFLSRFRHHVGAFFSTCFHGLEWFWIRRRPDSEFLKYLLVSVLFDFGEFVFFLLYNLYLVDRGFDEKFIGQVSAAFTAGTFAGALPASMLSKRIGLRNLVLLAVLGSAAAAVLRTLAASQSGLIISAFVNGLFLSFWAVSLPPAVAGLTSERHRTFGFSLISAVGIGMGVVAGLIGGRLPATLVHFYPALTAIGSKKLSLLAGSVLAASAIVPAALLSSSALPKTPTQKQKYPNSPFIWAFLGTLFVWTLGTGGFNPFFNVYFSRHLHATVEQIGLAFSYSQMAQIVGILLVPAYLRRVGTVTGIALLQLAAALALGLLALATKWTLGSILFVAYMSFQYMIEPGLLSMLMTRADRSEQTGASALNFFVISLAGILAAALAGRSIAHTGYEVTLFACAGVIAVAAAGFRLLVR